MFLSSAVRKSSSGFRHTPGAQRWVPGKMPTPCHGHITYRAQCTNDQCRTVLGRRDPVLIQKGLNNTERVKGFI
ncbi:hypothetical protein [Largemouth bass virus]|nr:hypothetical protein [Mandarin fish ranavirus]WEI28983.1 hypothetical protein [Largemouth bass virus]WHA35550.1 hypothetical protein MSRaV_62R [Micropterus salmoides ranavirus]WHA35655.1 hypothetical protein SCRaV_62R [Siniperca chuatsi ranavirus]